ncbi:kinase-like protein [Lizonia empirigonia]|nr:kinase-like protein [Lizonia empirigonia]
MHERSVRHKDIKPRNILVHGGSVIYTDFGYSREFVQLDSSTTEGRPDPYTKRYGAPEVRQEEKRNSSADVYSLGCVFVDIFAALTQAFEIDTGTDFSEYATRLRSGDGIATIPSKYGFLRWMILSMLLHEAGTRPRASEVVFQVQQQSGFICNDCGINSNPRARRRRTPVPPDLPNLTSYVATQGDLNATLEKLYNAKRAYHSLRSTQALRLDVQIIDALAESEFDNEPHQNYGGHSLEAPPLWRWEQPFWDDPSSAEFSTEPFNICETINQLERDMHKLCAQLLYMEIVLANYPSDLSNERIDALIKGAPFSQLQKAASEEHAGSGFTKDISTGKKVQDWLMDMLEKSTLGKTYLRLFLDHYEVQISEDETWFDSVFHYWELDGLMQIDNTSDTSSILCELPGLHDEIPTIFITEPTSYNKTEEWESAFGLEYWSQSVLDSLHVSTESVPREDFW